MLNRYRDILSLPGALVFTITGLFARAPMAMASISMILMVRHLYGSYSNGALVGAVAITSFAIFTPILANLVDRFGQAQVMIPSILVSTISLIATMLAAMNHLPIIIVTTFACIAGATLGSVGTLVRARWAYIAQDPGQVQTAYALETALEEVVLIVGPIIAISAASIIHPTGGLWLTVAFLLFGGFGFLLQKKTQPPVTPKVEGQKQPSIMRSKTLLLVALSYIAAGVMFGSMELSVVAFTETHGMAAAGGFFLAATAIGSLLSAMAYGAITWSQPLWKLYLLGAVTAVVGVSPLFFAPNLLVLPILLFIAGAMTSPTMTNVNLIVQHTIPQGRLTEGLAWMATAMTLGMSIGSAVSGNIVDTYGANFGFLLALAGALAMVVLSFFGVHSLRNKLGQQG